MSKLTVCWTRAINYRRLAHRGVSVAQWWSTGARKSEGLRFNVSLLCPTLMARRKNNYYPSERKTYQLSYSISRHFIVLLHSVIRMNAFGYRCKVVIDVLWSPVIAWSSKHPIIEKQHNTIQALCDRLCLYQERSSKLKVRGTLLTNHRRVTVWGYLRIARKETHTVSNPCHSFPVLYTQQAYWYV